MTVRFMKLNPDAKMPSYGSVSAAGADLYALEAVTIPAGESRPVRTGIALELPEGTVGLIYARSGLACKQGLAPSNKVGVIDCDYRGEITVFLHNHSSETRTVERFDRIAQLVITPYLRADFEQSDTLSSTERGVGGFGSTGTK